ncbi:MAG: peptidylprolyl isomerase [Planctomycetota bacterium]
MQRTWKFVVAAAAMGMWLTVAGCGPGGEDANETNAEPGSGAGDNPGAVQTASYAGGVGAEAAGPALKSAPLAVLIETTLGNITVELDDEHAPATVDNFLKYVDRGFYDQTIFHQVFPGAVILGGKFTEEFIEKQTDPPVNNEAGNGLKNQRGAIAMFREHDVINSATCQFFINVKDNLNYDHKPDAEKSLNPEDYGYCVFGRVTEDSMSVVDRIANVKVHDTADFEQTPVETVMIKSITKVR